MTAPQLITEFVTELIETLLMVWLMARARLAGVAARVGFAAVVGIVAAMTTNISYWNWYGFPTAYTAPYMTIEIVGYVVAGMVAAKILGQSAA